MIELQNICFEYGSEEQNIAGRGALHNINLHIPDGQIVLLCGGGCSYPYRDGPAGSGANRAATATGRRA